MRKKSVLRRLRPKQIEVPEVRVTSQWEPELLEMFKANIAEMGIRSPIICVQEGDRYILVDGKHRLDEARLQDMRTIDVAVIPGTMRDVMLQNLVLNRLRGRTPASQMVKVIGWLREKGHMSLDEIRKETGLRMAYIEKMLSISKCHPLVIEDLDAERIGVGHAHEISRVPDHDAQVRLLTQVNQFRIKVRDLKEIVDETLRIMAEKRESSPEAPPIRVPRLKTIQCHFCGEEYLLKHMTGVNVCINCYAACRDLIARAQAAVAAEKEKEAAGPAEETINNT